MSSLNKGQRIADRYVLLSRLHDGRHAQSWLAQDLEGRARLVLKVALADERKELNDALLRNEFEQGIKLNHPFVVRYFDHGTFDQTTFITREYCDDGNLTALRGRSWRQIVPVLAQLCDALEHVHQAGLVHRDVKAENVLLGDDGRAKLGDFGVASVAGEDGLRSGGSPQTASPEQRAGAPPDRSDDAWALGLLMFDLVTGIAHADSHEQRMAAWPDGVPDALLEQAVALTASDPAQRPASMAGVARALEGVLDADGNVTLPPEEFEPRSEAFDIIEPRLPDEATEATPLTPRDPGSRRGVPRSVGVIALGVLIVAAFGIIYLLRTFDPVATPVTGTEAVVERDATRAGEAVASAPAAEPVEPWKLAQQARLRDRAEKELGELLDRQFVLEEKKVDVWALDEYDTARALAIDGDKAFRQQEFQAAFDAYREGNELLGELVERSENLVEENLRAGFERIEQGRSEDAVANFELVLKVEEGNTRAQRGLARARNLDRVMALVEQARELEQYGEPAQALARFREAAELDPDWTDAVEGVRRVNRAMAGSRFNAAMSEGYAALSAKRFEAARAAFRRADGIRANTADVRDALDQLELAVRGQNVSSLRQRAEALEAAEDFAGALAVYREARALDPNLGFARDGEARNRERVELLETLNGYNDDPDRLVSDSVYANATEALERAQALATPGRALRTAMARLTAHLATSRTTAIVTLASDNLTDVLVYRVGRLGRFERQQLELRPGKYTVVGSRDGYRDVRREFRVGPGGADGVIDVRCEDRI